MASQKKKGKKKKKENEMGREYWEAEEDYDDGYSSADSAASGPKQNYRR